MPGRVPCIAAGLCALAVGCAPPTIRDREIAECRPEEIVTWGDGTDRPVTTSPLRFAYRHAGAPPWFARSDVETSISTAAAAWSSCGIPALLVTSDDAPGPAESAITIQWNERASMGSFGLANHGERTLSLGAYAFVLLNHRNPRHDARETLQLVISHEIGHFYGLQAHSRRCVDVLSYYTANGEACFTGNPGGVAGEGEYRSALPTACDIMRCRLVNGRADR